ncbi:LrgB family protein [Pseudoalteromonas gelatinilytica]|uniref:CidB/LrgB family autolysis modulator n=1 Tax=Pseudoalteromonas gelatinilytica TaxID=1703256 RepID=A0ABQ1T4Z0_9GAMM|nr:LrgB family protein [Pseudoalteromonas profundi]GGE83436.1 CidB/LrgB family autolysis modulator [Pseudoalteromonas profundi]
MTVSLWWLSVPCIIVLFLVLRFLNAKTQHATAKALSNPVCWAIVLTAALLVALKLPYEPFAEHSKVLSWLLEPAIVALALPLYQQFIHVKKNLLLILISCSLGVINATLVASLICYFFAAPALLSASLASLSVTTPITLLVTESLGGIPSLAAAMVIFIGVLGAIFGNLIFSLINIRNAQAKGVSIGTACHAIGTASLISDQPKAGAFASVAMALSALLSAIIVPILYPVIQHVLV